MKKIDLSKVKRFSIRARYSKVSKSAVSQLKRYQKTGDIRSLIPDILGGKDLNNLIKSIISAKRLKKPVILMMGAHPIKCGLSPLIIDLMRKGIITAVATNGACLVHDYELAFSGSTSEEVADALGDGSFGMTKETGQFLNAAASKASALKEGLGSMFGGELRRQKLSNPELSIFRQAHTLSVPVTVHVAIGTDIFFQHPECKGSSWGDSSYRDFLQFCETVAELGEGGVVINFGSAVVMPEIFLKALSIARNLGNKVKNFTTANFDMIKQYRALTNVVSRPVLKGGKGYNFTGQHELLFPVLYHGLTRAINARKA